MERAQVNSFEATLPCPAALCDASESEGTYRAVFIRAPGILRSGPGVEILSEYTLPEAVKMDGWEGEEDGSIKSVVVAVRQQNLLATAFHPELTGDIRWHKLFVKMVDDHAAAADFS